ncbi:6030_t:CDS:10 [Entrophospora sp. SA101]|nr:6030_t:CDS:10 [Entrophospora sp. SA101]
MNSKVTVTPDHKHSILTPTNEDLRQNNQKPQNDTVEPIVEVIGSPIIKELLQNPFIVDNKQGALFDKEYRFAQVLPRNLLPLLKAEASKNSKVVVETNIKEEEFSGKYNIKEEEFSDKQVVNGTKTPPHQIRKRTYAELDDEINLEKHESKKHKNFLTNESNQIGIKNSFQVSVQDNQQNNHVQANIQANIQPNIQNNHQANNQLFNKLSNIQTNDQDNKQINNQASYQINYIDDDDEDWYFDCICGISGINIKYYEFKQYKKGLKAAEQILKKFPEHGETLAMKGLFLNHMDRKEEAHDFVRKGIRYDLNSWHVYGLLHRSDKNYGEALKCYTRALKFDKDNMQILQDYSLLQIQMRNYEAYNESKHHLLSLRPNNQRNWFGLAISYHLLENYETAEKVLKSYEDTLRETSSPMNFERSEILLYHNFIIEESGDFEAALVHLDSIKNKICDRQIWKEKRAQFLLKLGKLQEATEAYRDLINDNPDCYAYFDGLLISKGLNISDLTPEQRKEILDLFKDLAEKYPKSNAIKHFPLSYAIGDTFRAMIDEYMQAALRKGVPSLFVNLKKLYTDLQKEKIIEELIEGYHQNLNNNGTFTQNGTTSDIQEPPTAYLWTLYLLAQHYDYKRDVVKALKFINKAIDHTPTLVELYMTKGHILKHGGDLLEATKTMNEARELDLQDRFINSKCVKYMLRFDQTDEAEKTIGLFTRSDASDPLTDLIDMQCMWFVLEEGESYMRRSKLGKALKRFHQIEKHFFDITDDQFDFHTYCLRKVTLRAYVSLLRLEDQLRSHPYYFRSAQDAIKIYLKLYDNPNIVSPSDNNLDYANMTENEIKKAKNKAKKAAIKAQKEAEAKKAPAKEEQTKKRIEKPQDDDPEGEKLVKTINPLEDAFKLLVPLQELSQKRIETHLLAFEIYIRKDKYLLALRSLIRAYYIDKENPCLHKDIVLFNSKVSNNTKIHETTIKVIEAERSKILPDNNDSLIQFNNEFLEKNKGSIEHLLAGVESLLIINPEKKQEAEALLLKVYEDEYLNNRTLKVFYETLKNTFESPIAEEFKKKCQEWFPISTYFRDSE